MKIAIPSTGKTMESQISQVFGRCPFYILVEVTENEEIKKAEAIENPAVEQRGGAGIAASQTLGNEGVDTVIATRVGPRAFDVLQRIDIGIYQGIEGTIQKNVDAFINGELEEITQPGQMGAGPKPGAGKRAGRGQGQSQGPGRGQGQGRGGSGPNRGR